MTFLRTTFLLCLAAFALTACERDATTDLSNQEVEFRKAFPEVLPLPNGFAPEGIVAGTGNDFYVGSLADGSIYRGDFRTGEGEIIFTPAAGTIAVGLAFDPSTKYLYVAGGPGGGAFVLDTRRGEVVVSFDFDGAFVNDVIITKEAAYFTDSFTPNLYRVDLQPNGQPTGETATLPLGEGFGFVEGGFNANGIEATPDGKQLIVVNSTLGALYLVDPLTGAATEIELSGGSVTAGDGILLIGKTLYVVQNRLNQIAEVSLSADYHSGTITDLITSPDFRVPTTVTRKGSTLYVVNARFGVAPGPEVEYEVVGVKR